MALTKRPRAAGARKPRKPAMSAADKQASINTVALAISAAETAVEHAMRMAAKMPEAMHAWRKENDIHIMMTGDVNQYIGRGLAALGLASSELGTAHRLIDDVREMYKIPKPAYTGPVTTLNGGGKN